MASQKPQVVAHLHGYRVARLFRKLTDRAEAGGVVSVALTLVTAEGRVEYLLSGAYEKRPKEATHDVMKFVLALLDGESDGEGDA